jgi:Cu-Zn family superoxide dismutase
MQRPRFAAFVASALLAIPIGSSAAETPEAPLGPIVGRAQLRNAAGEAVGTAAVRDTPNGVLLSLELKAVGPGTHGLHIHTTGVCTAPNFESSGAHLNPANRMHGFRNPAGPHAGDLPNVHVDASKSLTTEFFAPQLKVAQIFDADGSALVIHGMPDDYLSDPAGHAGDRLACGVIERRDEADLADSEGKADLYREGRDRASNDGALEQHQGAANQGTPHGE